MRNVSVFLFLLFFATLQAGKRDSLLKILASSAHDTTKIKAACKMTRYYLNNDADSTLRYCRLAEKLLQKNNQPKWKANVYLAYTNLYVFAKGDFAKAEQYATEALKYALQTKIVNLCGEAYLSLGSVYGSTGEYEKAVKNLMKAEKYFLSGKNLYSLSRLYNDMGILYYNQQDYDHALEFHRKSLAIKAQGHNLADLSHAYQNISGVFFDLKNYDSSLWYINRALEINVTLKDKVGEAMAYDGKAMVLRKLHKYSESLEAVEQARKIAEQLGDKWMLANTLQGIGELYEYKNNLSAAIASYQKSAAINSEIGAKRELFIAYEALSRCYQKSGDYKSAYRYFSMFSNLKDSVAGENVKKNVMEIEAKYKNEKKEKEIALLNRAKAEDSLKIALQEVMVKDKDLQIEKRRGQVKYLSVIAVILAAFGVWIFYALRNKQKANLIIQQQKKDVEFQKQLVDEKQKEIIDSINYAKRIQNTLLAPQTFINSHVAASVIFFRPKDIVSGDFYWATSVQNPAIKSELFFLAVCDSTGHGVPGAFMSVLNTGFLSEAIKEKNIAEPNLVFEHVRKRLVESISSEGQRDGFDGILVCIDKNKKQLIYAAANNGPFYISEGRHEMLSCDKMHVGKGEKQNEFKAYTLNYREGDWIYLFTDGYADQFGGPKGKKFKYKQLEELILKINSENPETQKQILSDSFDNWRGQLEQVDDVCVIGLRL